MTGVLGHNSADEMNFVMNYAPGVGSIAQPVGQQSSALTFYEIYNTRTLVST